MIVLGLWSFHVHETSFFRCPCNVIRYCCMMKNLPEVPPKVKLILKLGLFFYQIETLVDFSGKKTNHDLFVRTKYAMPQN